MSLCPEPFGKLYANADRIILEDRVDADMAPRLGGQQMVEK